MKRATDDFFLMKLPTDTTKYKAVITNCVLYVKVAHVSDVIYKEVFTRHKEENIRYQFRKMVVKDLKVDYMGVEFISGPLFPDSTIPCKLYFVLVLTTSKIGSQTSNPYQFTRKFMLKKPAALAFDLAGQIQNCYIKDTLGQLKTQISSDMQTLIMRNHQMMMEMFAQQFASQNASAATESPVIASGSRTEESTPTVYNTRSGKSTPGMATKNPGLRRPQLPSQEDSGLVGSHENANVPNENASGQTEELDDSSSEQSFQTTHGDLRTLNRPPPVAQVGDDIEHPVYITKFQLENNSTPIDQVIIQNKHLQYVPSYYLIVKFFCFFFSF